MPNKHLTLSCTEIYWKIVTETTTYLVDIIWNNVDVNDIHQHAHQDATKAKQTYNTARNTKFHEYIIILWAIASLFTLEFTNSIEFMRVEKGYNITTHIW